MGQHHAHVGRAALRGALIPILYLTQAFNAILLPPLPVMMWRIGRDPVAMGNLATGDMLTWASSWHSRWS